MEKEQTSKGVERPGETDEIESAMKELVVEAPRQKEEGRVIEEDRREKCLQKKKRLKDIHISVDILKAKEENEQEIKQGDAMNKGKGDDVRGTEKSTPVTRCMPLPMAHRIKNIRIARGRNLVTSDVDSEEEKLLPGTNIELQKKDLIDVREGLRADDQQDFIIPCKERKKATRKANKEKTMESQKEVSKQWNDWNPTEIWKQLPSEQELTGAGVQVERVKVTHAGKAVLVKTKLSNQAMKLIKWKTIGEKGLVARSNWIAKIKVTESNRRANRSERNSRNLCQSCWWIVREENNGRYQNPINTTLGLIVISLQEATIKSRAEVEKDTYLEARSIEDSGLLLIWITLEVW
ncbi:unnamed protein product [Nezara viridula]|uniref:Uncharacterized protein n=1 Tax=Nezara viridula TaxID=85310 RepID=A0A9P0EA09_NEZVI|nr:unnamed protein product [Nezara viridula]